MAAVQARRRRRRQINVRLPRVFRDRSNPMDNMNDEELFDRYRFRRPTITYILNSIYMFLDHPTKRNYAIAPVIQVLVFLRFVATGAHLRLVGDHMGITESSAGRACRSVSSALNRVFIRKIAFPVGEKARQVMEGFRRIAGFPNVIGCVDGTHVKIIAPKENENVYVNRKGYHSLNVQMVCDPNFRITSLVAKWPGSVHDSRIWRTSNLYHQFEQGMHSGMLLGGSGYPCSKHLLTPYLVADTVVKQNFNRALCRTRVLIEQSYGILKRRFNVLHDGFRTSPGQAAQYIISCVILHDIGIDKNDVVVSNNINNILVGECAEGPHINPTFDGSAKRNEIARQFFFLDIKNHCFCPLT